MGMRDGTRACIYCNSAGRDDGGAINRATDGKRKQLAVPSLPRSRNRLCSSSIIIIIIIIVSTGSSHLHRQLVHHCRVDRQQTQSWRNHGRASQGCAGAVGGFSLASPGTRQGPEIRPCGTACTPPLARHARFRHQSWRPPPGRPRKKRRLRARAQESSQLTGGIFILCACSGCLLGDGLGGSASSGPQDLRVRVPIVAVALLSRILYKLRVHLLRALHGNPPVRQNNVSIGHIRHSYVAQQTSFDLVVKIDTEFTIKLACLDALLRRRRSLRSPGFSHPCCSGAIGS